MPLPPPPAKKAARLALDQHTIQTAGAALSRKNPSPSIAVAAPVPVATLAGKARHPSQTQRTRSRKAQAGGTANTLPAIDMALQPGAAQVALVQATMPEPLVANPRAVTPVVAEKNTKKSGKAKVRSGPTKLFVLDTNVLLHDPMSLFRFEEHDVYLPMIVLEELDGQKKGMTEVARNGRQASRTLDALAALAGGDMTQGLPLSATGHTSALGRLFFQTEPLDYTLPTSLPQGKADNQILGVVQALSERHKGRVVAMVSKDINMRIKARALGLDAQD